MVPIILKDRNKGNIQHDIMILERINVSIWGLCILKRICQQCHAEMVNDCAVTVQGGMYGIKISRKGNGLFNKASAIPKAAVCPNCGGVAFYIDEYKQFKK